MLVMTFIIAVDAALITAFTTSLEGGVLKICNGAPQESPHFLAGLTIA